MKRLAFLLPLLAFALLAGGLWRALALDQALPSALVDRPAPDFALPWLDDPARQLKRDDLRGKVWVLNVWASWCAGCRDELPALKTLAREGGVPLIGLNHKDERQAAIGWLERFGNPYTLSVSDTAGRIGLDYGVYGVPETFVIDRDGRVRLRIAGALTRDRIERELRPALERLGG